LTATAMPATERVLLLHGHGNSHANASQCNAVRTLSVLLYSCHYSKHIRPASNKDS